MNPYRSIPVLNLTLGLILLAGCQVDGPSSAAFLTRDSAGITIAENRDSTWTSEEGWRLSDNPVLEIGGLNSGPDYEFWKISRALRTSEGRILVANGGTLQARYFDGNGGLLSSFGGEGEGPGEFRRISEVFLTPGDSVLVYDGGLRRVSLYDPMGSYIDQLTLPSRTVGFSVRPEGILPRGRLLLTGGGATSFASGGETQIVEDSLWYLTCDRTGSTLDTIGRFPGSDRYIISTDLIVGIIEPPFARQASVAVYQNRIFHGLGDRYEVRVLSPDGSLRRIIRRELPARALTENLIERYVSPEVPEGEEVGPSWWEEEARAFDFRPTLPFFDRLMTDNEGHLWVRRLTWPEQGDHLWDIFDREGRLVASLRSPVGLEIHDIGPDYVLGVWKNELDVEYVRMYDLDRAR